MGKELRELLFAAHSADLLDVMPDITTGAVPDLSNTFVCPICLRGFHRDGIYDKTLTDGHIWPKDIRLKGIQAKHQRVLVCDVCNSTAGKRGDSQMQLLEAVREADREGDYGERRVQILLGPGDEPITLNARIVVPDKDNPTNAKIYFPVDVRRRQWARNDPREQARFETLKSQDRHFSMIVHPHHLLRPKVARVGWLTSAYLMAFYSFGYRYILHSSLNPVRQCILDSFTNDAPLFPESETLSVRQCDVHYHEDPEIAVILPMDGKTSAYLQVSFWDYHIRLPFFCDAATFQALIQSRLPDDFALPSQDDPAISVGVSVLCTKSNIHDCIWDYVLGKAVPSD